MQSTTSKESKPARITALWFGVQLIWGAVLGISLQARYLQLTSGSSLELFGWISASGAGAAAITQLVVGPISDAMRRRGRGRGAFYAAGALLGAVAILAFYASSSVYGLLGSFVALQIALNIIIGPYQAIIPDLIPPQRFGVASAWLAAMGSAGNACGAILATLLGGTLRLGLALAAGLLASASITILYSRRLPMQPLSPAASFTANRTLVDLFVSRAFVYLGFYTILLYLYFFVASILPHGFALDATRTTGLCVLLFTVVGALGALLAARPADRSDERLVVSVGGCLVALSLAVLAQIHAMGALVPAIALAGVGWGIFLCADWAFACRLLPPAALATRMAIWNLAVVGPQMLAPLVATVTLSQLGVLRNAMGPRDALLLGGAEMLIGTLWIWRLPGAPRGHKAYGHDCMEPKQGDHAL
ncbi:MAG: MFS transporter [Candidatus Aquilonibacter sp.]